MLEATPKALRRLTKRMQAGRTYFPLLGADIMNVLRTVRARNPNVQIFGIEETDGQQKEQNSHSGSRAQSIAQNFWSRYRPGRRHLILFGALHCTNEPNWLSKRLYDQAPIAFGKPNGKRPSAGRTSNWPGGSLCVFFSMRSESKRPPSSFRTPVRCMACIYDWFPSLNRQALQKYRSLIVFRR